MVLIPVLITNIIKYSPGNSFNYNDLNHAMLPILSQYYIQTKHARPSWNLHHTVDLRLVSFCFSQKKISFQCCDGNNFQTNLFDLTCISFRKTLLLVPQSTPDQFSMYRTQSFWPSFSSFIYRPNTAFPVYASSNVDLQ